jgi:hypothetical protein
VGKDEVRRPSGLQDALAISILSNDEWSTAAIATGSVCHEIA